MPSVERMREILNSNLNALSKGDWNAYKQLFSEHPVYEEEATNRHVTGADEIVKAVEPWKRAFPDLTAHVKEAIGSGDALVVEIEWTGTHKGPLAGAFGTIPPTGKPGKLPAVLVARFDGERIRELRHYFDLLTMLAQIGAAPQVGAPTAR